MKNTSYDSNLQLTQRYEYLKREKENAERALGKTRPFVPKKYSALRDPYWQAIALVLLLCVLGSVLLY